MSVGVEAGTADTGAEVVVPKEKAACLVEGAG